MGIAWLIVKVSHLSVQIDGSWVIIFALVTCSLAASFFRSDIEGGLLFSTGVGACSGAVTCSTLFE